MEEADSREVVTWIYICDVMNFFSLFFPGIFALISKLSRCNEGIFASVYLLYLLFDVCGIELSQDITDQIL